MPCEASCGLTALQKHRKPQVFVYSRVGDSDVYGLCCALSLPLVPHYLLLISQKCSGSAVSELHYLCAEPILYFGPEFDIHLKRRLINI